MESSSSSCIVAICAATGKQGKEVIRRFKEINESKPYGSKVFHLKALTRNASSADAIKVSKIPYTTVAETDYSSKSLKDVLTGVDALYLNYAMVKNEADIESRIIDVALESCIQHIIYASTVGCERDHGVPHWTSSYRTEEYLKLCHEKQGKDFKYHLVRLGHFNENILPGSYMPPKNGTITYPWGANVPVVTSSLRDVARVVCKLFAEPWKLQNGCSIDAITEYVTVSDIAASISKAKGETISAAKGPWIFTTFGHWFGWEANTILCMAKYIDAQRFPLDFDIDGMRDFLEKEIRDDNEPLETMEKFAFRHFSSEPDPTSDRIIG